MQTTLPLILITNDDGINAPGIGALVDAMKNLGEVAIVAPDKAQSGMGHAITINSTLRIKPSYFHHVKVEYSCSGTPVDCVKIALTKLLDRKPDLIVSGINHGTNSSINVIYSGTMSAAVEGAIEGVPSIGFSLGDFSIGADFSASKVVATSIASNVLKTNLPKGVCLNVNIPPLHLNEIQGIRYCRQGRANWKEELDERFDPSGNPYYWLTGKFENLEEASTDTDVWALANGFVSVVPVQFDLTAHSFLPELKHWTTAIEKL